MKKHFKILDCTLRDGGYYTDWDFTDEVVSLYLKAMQQLPVDILEIGYRAIPQKTYMGKYFYTPEYVLRKVAAQNPEKTLALMVNEKETLIPDLPALLKGLKPHVSLIRMAVDPAQFPRALEVAMEIKAMGFEVAFNAMYMSKYCNNPEFLQQLHRLNGVVTYLNIVDSYGGMLPDQVADLVSKVRESCEVTIGFHGHNNLELAFANTLAAIEAGCGIVDTTILGMGRGAGNMKTELLLTYLASTRNVKFDFNHLSALVETWTTLKNQYGWGTNLPYMVSGANSLPQKDVMEWVTQRYYSINSIIRALHLQKEGNHKEPQLPVFTPERTYDSVVIIGGGPNAVRHATAIKQFICAQDNVCIIHASSKNAKSYDELDAEQLFCLVGNEGHRLEKVFENLNNFTGKCILPPSPRKMGTYVPMQVQDNAVELESVSFTDQNTDSHTALALQVSLDLKAKNIYLAGYDGYQEGNITRNEQNLIVENEHAFAQIQEYTNLISLLPTHYEIPVQSVYSML
jgi:4-hydroxy 2-oxovalerate aldolase